jgi:hypothetical protein
MTRVFSPPILGVTADVSPAGPPPTTAVADSSCGLTDGVHAHGGRKVASTVPSSRKTAGNALSLTPFLAESLAIGDVLGGTRRESYW